MLITKTLPNLINGVSQQPDALRYDTQCTAQENAYPSVVEGLTKRLPTEHVAQTNLTTDAKTYVHTIDREGDEKYTVLLRDKQIRVYDKDGTLKTVELGEDTGTHVDNITYLDTDNADTELKALTIADVTYIVNTKATVKMGGQTPSSVAEYDALVFVKQAYDSTYKIELEQGGVELTASFTASSSSTMDTSAIATGLANVVDNVAETIEFLPTVAGGANSAPQGNESRMTAQSFIAASSARFSSVTWISDNDMSDRKFQWSIWDDDNGSPGTQLNPDSWKWGPPALQEQTVTIKSFYSGAPVSGQTYWIVLRCWKPSSAGGYWRTIRPGWLVKGGNQYADGMAFWGNNSQPSYDFWFRLNTTSGTTKFEAEAKGPTVYVTSNEPFTLSATNTHTDAYISSFAGRTQKLTDLPRVAKDGMILKVFGSVDGGADDYYVKFVSNSQYETLGEGAWEECAGPGIEDGAFPIADSMPHLLIKQPNGTFVFKTADGENHTSTSTGTTATYDYSKFAWGHRLAGDKTTNPDPTFIGKTVNNLFLFKNRFGMLSDENIILSEAGEYFNFFRTTTIDLLDTAPVDIASASSKVSILRHAIPLSEKLVILSDSSQFILQSDTALSSKTVSLARSTAYNILKDPSPTATENSLFFAFNRGSYSGVREYMPANVEDNFEGIDISAQVPKYIPGKITKLVSANHENMVFCLTEGDTSAVYAYNYFTTANKRVQSAWHRWEFGAGAKILNIDLIGTELFLTIYRLNNTSGGVYLEKMAIELGKTDPSSSYVARLDRRISNTSTGVVVNGTAVTLPYVPTTGRNVEIITLDGERIRVTQDGDDTNQFTAAQDMTGKSFYAGEAYTMSYTFSDVVLREPTQTGGLALVTDGRVQIRYGTITFGESGSFDVNVTPDFRDTSAHTFTGRVLGAGSMKLGEVPLESGKFRFPVFSKADQVGITLTNDSPLPCNLLSAEYEISWNPRSRRSQRNK